jgi:glutamate 5-kinase
LKSNNSRCLPPLHRLVIKVGTRLLTQAGGQFDARQIAKIVGELALLAGRGQEVILVTSGAIGAGVGRLGLGQRPKTLPEKQAAAAIGQGILMHKYEELFGEYNQIVAQILLTRADVMDRRRYLNARHTLITLLQYGVIPIINENDTVAVEEIRLGDNDTLAALVAALVEADLLILLTDTEGLYTADPQANRDATLISVVPRITAEVEQLAGGAGSKLATGGMSTKIQAAKICTNSGIPMVIASGWEEGILQKILTSEEKGTLFLPKEPGLQAKKRWIAYAFGTAVQGKVHIDAGAAAAIQDGGSSLLPIGVTATEGSFEAGNVVGLVVPTGEEIARGIVNYNTVELGKIMGKKSSEIAAILGYKDYDEVIHRNNLVLND